MRISVAILGFAAVSVLSAADVSAPQSAVTFNKDVFDRRIESKGYPAFIARRQGLHRGGRGDRFKVIS